MKCIKRSSGEIERISDERATSLVNSGNASFIPKSIWKSNVRDFKQDSQKIEKTEEVKQSNTEKGYESIKGKGRKKSK